MFRIPLKESVAGITDFQPHSLANFVIEFRSFLNTDPPAIIDVWQQQKPIRCLAQVVTRKLLDHMVFAKPYFDPAGFILAFENGQCVGFIHIGFCPDSNMSCVNHDEAILSQIRVVDGFRSEEIADGLWQRAKTYMQNLGTHTCYAGGKFPCSPFYAGLYGGSRIPGIPAEDLETARWMERFGFEISQQIDVMQLNLVGYRTPVSRTQMTVRRKYQVAAIVDPLLPNWWESCTFGWAEVFGFRVVKRNSSQVLGSLMLWEIQPLSSQWGCKTMGLVDLQVDLEHQHEGLATFLVGESLKHLAQQGAACVELQTRESDSVTIGLANKFGFETVTTGNEMQISIDANA